MDAKVFPLNLTLCHVPVCGDIFKMPDLLCCVSYVLAQVCIHEESTHVSLVLKFQFESSIYLGSMCQSICCWKQRHKTVSFSPGVLYIPSGFGMSSFHSSQPVLMHREHSVVSTKLEA